MPSETTTATTTTSSSSSSSETLEAEIYKHLTETSALDELHAELLFSLQRAGWTERIQSLTLDLLRAGRCSQFDELVDVVVALAAGEAHPTVPEADSDSSNSTTTTTNGHGGTTNGVGSSEPLFNNLDVRIPKDVVDQGVKALKDSIRPIATIEGDEDTSSAAEADAPSSHNTSKSDKKPNKTSTKDSRLKTAADASPSKNAAANKKAKSGGK
ncbi:uncharacterized protein TRUGW13939_05422 [Talaromyces rugulosus]|uniref:Uncharacterized protein n=1 Tax=Talaromyces rugulosus TaxID=121627 RepID=A0A7H8QW83_TALRU|nr:uncharacterized protein TRUGW13939_05422 [Talaromyces rugulosus]QKX58300.1 hypothetical protein TRUGW13939_05422 [Talaromyces rugulosus]